MGDIVKLAVVLLVISMAAGLTIGFTNSKTKDKIKLQEGLKDKNALIEVFPEGVTTTEHTSSASVPGPYWLGKKGEKLIGYAFKGAGRGYSGDIKFMIALDPQGTILGLTILDQTETPGLGTRVQESISKKYFWNGLFGPKEKVSPWFSNQFKGLNITRELAIDRSGEWHKFSESDREALLKNNKVTALTGATISTKAVTDGIKKYANTYYSKLKALHN